VFHKEKIATCPAELPPHIGKGEELMEQKKELGRLISLAHMDADAVGAYEAAIQRVSEPLVQDKLSEFRIDHVRHVQDLNVFIQKFGGEPVVLEVDWKGKILRGVTALTSRIGTEGALLAMLGNEEFTNRAYDLVLQLDWTAEIRQLVEKNRRDERRHLAWVKDALRHRPWVAQKAETHA